MWFIIGIIVGAAVLGLVWALGRRNIYLNWYEWLVGIIGLGLLLFTIQNFFGSYSELEVQAAYMFLPVTGLPSLIFLGVAWQLAAKRAQKASQK